MEGLATEYMTNLRWDKKDRTEGSHVEHGTERRKAAEVLPSSTQYGRPAYSVLLLQTSALPDTGVHLS